MSLAGGATAAAPQSLCRRPLVAVIGDGDLGQGGHAGSDGALKAEVAEQVWCRGDCRKCVRLSGGPWLMLTVCRSLYPVTCKACASASLCAPSVCECKLMQTSCLGIAGVTSCTSWTGRVCWRGGATHSHFTRAGW